MQAETTQKIKQKRNHIPKDTPEITPILFRRETLAKKLNKTVASVALAVAKRNENLVPMPIKIGRHLFWTQEIVDAWIAKKTATQTVKPIIPLPTITPEKVEAEAEVNTQAEASPAEPKRRGASTKAERRAKRLAAQAGA